MPALSLMRGLRPLRQWPIAARYLATSAIVGLALALRLIFSDWLFGLPFIVFYPAVMLCALLFDRGTGAFAAVLSAVLAYAFFIAELPMARQAAPLVALGIYTATTLGMAVIIEMLRQAVVTVDALHEAERRAAEERAALLDELAHRTKNNLQIVGGLLQMHGRQVADPEAKAALRRAAEQIVVFSRVHARLQHDRGVAEIDVEAFLRDLCDDLQQSLVAGRPIAFDLDCPPLRLPSTLAVPVGLIVNELATNAVKYAFPDERPGRIAIAIGRSPGRCRLSVGDNGVGHATGAQGGVGSRLVERLVNQLRGEVAIDSGDGGTTVVVTFPTEG
ncbi:MAG TPA: histidine kinase dimerization/phosphoacceptor domain -containing protein [Alphaproteobacteria bacterium]|nr:histidine kinase dimerization/phosphoacceptor domain -containing protein [Alphaproteobacteria bacterium]